VLERFEGALPGAACNAEFRGRFAAHLKRRLTARQLGEAYLFLGARWQALDEGSLRGPLTAFAGSTRRPPLHWTVRDQAHRAQILRWTGRSSTGRALQGATEKFWSDSEPSLGSIGRTCPAAAARWTATQARLLAAIDSEEARRDALRKSRSR
jgi:hypothetical protein